ncbi:MAG: hypothetical protein JSU69_00455, partial [Candidatus Zixiibacteriota bacterium]
YGRSSASIVIATDSSLTILGRRWEVRSEIKLDSSQEAVVSDNGLYYAILETFDQDGDDSSVIVATLYDNRGMPTWAAYDLIEGQYHLSPSGKYIVAISGTPGHYDFEMVLYHESEATVRYNIEYFEDIIFSPAGARFIIGSGPKGVRLFSATGRMLQEFESKKAFAFSETGKLIGLFKNGLLDVLRENGRKITIAPKKITLAGMKLQESAHLAAVAFRKLLVVASLEDGSLLWRYTTGKEGGLFTSVDISPDGNFVACGVDVILGRGVQMSERHVKSFLYLYDAWGQSVELLEIKFENYAAGMPEVTFSPDNRIIFVRTADALHFIKMY